MAANLISKHSNRSLPQAFTVGWTVRWRYFGSSVQVNTNSLFQTGEQNPTKLKHHAARCTYTPENPADCESRGGSVVKVEL